MIEKSLYVFSNIEKSFSKKKILLEVDITLNQSKCLLLSGKNGSGKSTLLKILAGIEKPDKALIEYEGQLYRWKNICNSIRKNIIYLHQHPFMFDGTVESNIAYGLRFTPLSRIERGKALREALEWSGLTEIAKNNAKTLSGGVQQRVAFTRAWILKPKVLLLDEPMSNMDDESREKTSYLLNQMKQEGLSIVITSHISQNIDELVNNYYYLSEGNLKVGKTF